MKHFSGIRRNLKRDQAFGFPQLDNFITKSLDTSKKKTVRMLIRMACIFASTAALFLLIPFYPVYIALLFGFALGALGTRFPKVAIALGILLSFPAMVYQEAVEAPLFIAYLLICMLPFVATKVRWINGFLVVISIELAFIPQLSFLSPLPIVIAGLMFSPQDGAIVGLCASLAILFFLIIGAPLHGLIRINETSIVSYKESGGLRAWKPVLTDFKPISLVTYFDDYTNTNAGTHWRQAFSFVGKMLEKFLYDIYLWVLPALWCVSGYVASKAVQWYKKVTFLSDLPAIITATVFLIAGYVGGAPPQNLALIVGVLAIAAMAGFTASLFHVKEGIIDLESQAAEIKAKLDKTRLTVQEISVIGQDTNKFESKLDELYSKTKSIATLSQNRKLNEASTLIKSLKDETTNLEETTSSQLSKLVHLDTNVRARTQDIENNLREAKSTLSKAKKIFSPSDMQDEEKEIERIQKSLADARRIAQKGQLEEASGRLEQLLKESKTAQKDISEIFEAWSNLPLWTKAIETKLAANGEVNIQTIQEIPQKWRKYAVNHYMKEKEDLGLEFQNGTLYLPKTEPQTIGAKEKEKELEKATTVKPAPTYPLDSIILNYIQAHGGTISLIKATKDLKLSMEELKASIERLKEKGLIE